MSDGAESKHSIRMVADRLLVVESKEAGERKSRAGILIPATADVSRRLVWAAFDQAGLPSESFRVAEDRTLADSADEQITLEDDTSVGIAEIFHRATGSRDREVSRLEAEASASGLETYRRMPGAVPESSAVM